MCESPAATAATPDKPPPAPAQAATPHVPAKRVRRNLSAFPVLDFLAVVAAFCAGYVIRFYAHEFFRLPGAFDERPPFEDYIPGALIFAALWIFYMYRKNVYGRKLANLTTPPWTGGGTWFVCGWKSLIALMAISFAWRSDMMVSRQVYVISWVVGWAFLMTGRVAATLALRLWRRRRGRPARRVALLGESPALSSFAERMRQVVPDGNFSFVPVHPDADGRLPPPDAATDVVVDLSRCGAYNADDSMVELLNACEAKGLPLYALPGMVVTSVNAEDLGDFLGTPLVRLRDTAIHPVYAVFKRLADIAFSLLVLVAGLPLWALAALLVRLGGPGKVLYSEKRVGLHGKPFLMYKFRSMHAGADDHVRELIRNRDPDDEPVFNIRGDNRVTKVGWWLRRLSLDEVPQLWNVLKGDMSWIGPRPERQELVDLYTPFQRRRLKARPGISGYQQVVSRGDPSLARRLSLDLYYMKRQGFWMDLTIALRTIWVVVRGHGLY